MTEAGSIRGVSTKRAGVALLAAALAPFIVTGVFRFVSDSVVIAVLVIALLGAAVLAWRPYGRAAAAGLILGSVLWALALAFLLAQFDGLSQL